MPDRLKKFLSDEAGAVTTDFIVLTAIVVTMTTVSLNAISNNATQAAIAAAAGIDSMDDDL